MSMADVFANAIDAAYAANGEAATYVPRAGASMAVTVVHGMQTAAPLGFESGATQTDNLLRVRVSEVAEPARGDTLTLADASCVEVRDAERLNRWEWGLVLR